MYDSLRKLGFPGSSAGKESACKSTWQPTAVLLPWRIPWTEQPGRLQPMGSQRAGHDWAPKHSPGKFVVTHDSLGQVLEMKYP